MTTMAQLWLGLGNGADQHFEQQYATKAEAEAGAVYYRFKDLSYGARLNDKKYVITREQAHLLIEATYFTFRKVRFSPHYWLSGRKGRASIDSVLEDLCRLFYATIVPTKGKPEIHFMELPGHGD